MTSITLEVKGKEYRVDSRLIAKQALKQLERAIEVVEHGEIQQ